MDVVIGNLHLAEQLARIVSQWDKKNTELRCMNLQKLLSGQPEKRHKEGAKTIYQKHSMNIEMSK